MQRILTTAAAGVTLSIAAPVAAQDAGGDAPLVDVRYRGLSEVEPAAKDAAAHRALVSLGSRLRLLPREIPDLEADRKWIDTLWNVAMGGGGLAIRPSEGVPLISASLTPRGGTEGVLPAIAQMLDASGGPGYAVNEDGSLRLDTPDGWLHLGEARVGGREAISIRLGEGPMAEVDPAVFDLPTNVDPTFSVAIEVGQLLSMLSDEIERNEPQMAEQIERFGFLNAGDARAEFAFGARGDAAYAAGRLTDAKPWLGRFFGEASFGQDDLRLVPADATVVAGACVDLSWTLEVIQAISEDTGRDIVKQVREGFGIDLDSGVLSNIGPRWMFYQSDTTGGGGVLSAVLIAEIRDPEAFAQSHAAALVHANQFGSALGRGYARTREWQLEGNTAWSAVFPGIPVPIEPSWTVVDGWLIAAATPVGLASAVAQTNAGTSVLDNAAFSQAITDRWPAQPVMQLQFIDAHRFAAKGYGPMSLAASALANAVRQPFNAGAEPGTIMPAYASFTDGIRPTGSITTWDGDDLVQRASMDSSALVQIAAVFGQSSGWQSMYAPAMGAGVLLPALGKARESAQQVKSSTQVRSVIQGALVLQHDEPDVPPTIARMLEVGLITDEILESPMGNAWDGGPDIVLRQNFGDARLDSFDATLIVAMDRAMYVNGEDVVNIGFADGHVEAVSYWEVDEWLDDPKNAGLREEWDLD